MHRCPRRHFAFAGEDIPFSGRIERAQARRAKRFSCSGRVEYADKFAGTALYLGMCECALFADEGGVLMGVRDLMPLQLVYFVNVYRYRSYSKAADMIPMSRQGLIRSIQRLERSIDDRLFIENDSLLSPTAKADELYDLVMKWFDDLNKLEDSFRLLDSSQQIISFTDASGTQGLLGFDYIARFENEHPTVRIEYYHSTDFGADEALLNKEVDLAITTSPFNELFQTEILREVSLCALVRSDSALACSDSLSAADLEGQTIYLVDKSVKISQLVDNSMLAIGVRPAQEIATDEVNWIPSCVSRTGGVGITAEHVLSSLFVPADVTILPFRGFVRQYGISKLPETKLTPDEKAFVGYLRRLCS